MNNIYEVESPQLNRNSKRDKELPFWHILVCLFLTLSVSCEKIESFPKDVCLECVFQCKGGLLQGAACYGDILFQFTRQDSDNDMRGVHIIDIKQKKQLQFVDLGYNKYHHNSHASFGVDYYSRGDKFPLLYVSENYAPASYFKILVYRIVETNDIGHKYSIELVQTIDMPDLGKLDRMMFPHAIVDKDKKKIWLEGYSADSKNNVFYKFNLPKYKQGKNSKIDDFYLDSFSLEREASTDQSYIIHNNKIYQIAGLNDDAQLFMIDLKNKQRIKRVSFNELGYENEPEGVFVWNNFVMVSFSNGDILKMKNL